MKKDIHPEYHQATVKCACGNQFSIGSTLESIEIELCSNCHPLYTGKQKLVDTAGRVDKFKDRLAKKSAQPKVKAKKARSKTLKAETMEKTIKDLIKEERDKSKHDQDKKSSKTKAAKKITPKKTTKK